MLFPLPILFILVPLSTLLRQLSFSASLSSPSLDFTFFDERSDTMEKRD